MMVNQLNNNSVPWQSTIPQQMPWMSSHQNSSLEMQFGQTFSQPVSNQDPTQMVTAQLESPQNLTSASFKTLSPPRQPPITNNVDRLGTCFPAFAVNNPFDPWIANQNLSNMNQITNTQYPSPIDTGEAQFVSQTHPHCSQSLIHMAFDPPSSEHPVQQKRNSMEMEDELIREDEPPTKQQLSENKLFKRFGSLQLDGQVSVNCDDDKDSSSSEDETTGTIDGLGLSGRREFSRYVYLLFKEKKTDKSLFSQGSSGAHERLIREEREKLSKAVVLWSPPLKDSFTTCVDSDDDEEFVYSDHRDFLKNSPNHTTNDSIVITEITEDISSDAGIMDSNSIVADDKMIEE